MKNRSGLTLTVVFEAESANYGEGYRNLTVLKKMTKEGAKEYSYISRQALRYDLVRTLGWDNTPIIAQGGGDAKVAQFAPSATVLDYPEVDLFGYMKTTSKGEENERGGATTRSAVARLSNAISLEPFHGDMDYLTNMSLAKRGNVDNAIAQSEIHHSYYTYTVAIDLDRVGIDGNLEISNEEKANRVNKLLDAIEYLYRDIKGRRENLAPLFVIGGLYERKNPYFEHRIQVKNNELNVEILKELWEEVDIQNHTHVGVLSGIFKNTDEIKNVLPVSTVHDAFESMKKEVYEYYC